ncbi:MAG: family transcriptional regulator, cyclic receptor protein [Frankiaceae bacterium]|jgi:CRP-like cAMP-binding protein|nr:family transcriptional regulator, cyclic receptor protein [Frankiaceae bacterium]MDX6224219.1 family transcriptional regulator, cyclic receptor protein [Frankiales bacterium]
MGDLAGDLGRAGLFEGVERPVLDRLAGASVVRSLRRGQILFDQGDPGGTLVAVLDGRLALSLHSRDGDRMVLGVVTGGGTLGELSVADGGPRSSGAEALEATRVALIPRAAVLAAAAASPQLLDRLFCELAGIARRQTDASADLTFLDLPRRLARRLLTSANGEDVVDLGLSQRDLAAMVGGSRQSVNQALGEFQRRGWLKLEGTSIRLLDSPALSRYAEA